MLQFFFSYLKCNVFSINKKKYVHILYELMKKTYLKLTLLFRSFCHSNFPSSQDVHAGDYCRGGIFYARNFRRIRKNQIPSIAIEVLYKLYVRDKNHYCRWSKFVKMLLKNQANTWLLIFSYFMVIKVNPYFVHTESSSILSKNVL